MVLAAVVNAAAHPVVGTAAGEVYLAAVEAVDVAAGGAVCGAEITRAHQLAGGVAGVVVFEAGTGAAVEVTAVDQAHELQVLWFAQLRVGQQAHWGRVLDASLQV